MGRHKFHHFVLVGLYLFCFVLNDSTKFQRFAPRTLRKVNENQLAVLFPEKFPCSKRGCVLYRATLTAFPMFLFPFFGCPTLFVERRGFSILGLF